MDHVQNIMVKATEYKQSFSSYAYLWTDDRSEYLNQFLRYNHVLSTDEIKSHSTEKIPDNPPTLQQFKEQVCVFKEQNSFIE